MDHAPRGLSNFSLEGLRAVVTGGGGGIGTALVTELLACGADVAVIEHPARPETPALRRAAESLGRRLHWFSADLASLDELDTVVDTIWTELGGFDILVNNAGISTLAWYSDHDLQTWRRTLAVNLDAPFLLSRATGTRMIGEGRRGRIIMISSKNGQVAEQGLIAYNVSKAGLEMLAQSLAVELGPFGITVNSVCPGMIETGMADDFSLDWPAFRQYYEEHIPLGGAFADPVDVAGAVVLLSSPAGSYITGQSLVVDGGVLAQQLPRARFMRPPMPAPAAGRAQVADGT
ncbi:SDR family oxidoreductase [Amnibacterium sp. CER49]|uniref:SDR family NAD(P)-dependent oxidoreductase n=1 Tax=Amnibacterium sp. CER49 TaxID=3039161 RepID=UPI00244BCAC0|nr:SDR family oxidoreductase [Amnibacterium sp. CER49]MDH2442850.1 SDR family oxidoreductase [Amnibacterium sp. CER49]